MARSLKAQVYTNKAKEKGLSVGMSFDDAQAIADGDKAKHKEMLTAIKEAVKANSK